MFGSKKVNHTERFCCFCNTTTLVAVSLNLKGSKTLEKGKNLFFLFLVENFMEKVK